MSYLQCKHALDSLDWPTTRTKTVMECEKDFLGNQTCTICVLSNEESIHLNYVIILFFWSCRKLLSSYHGGSGESFSLCRRLYASDSCGDRAKRLELLLGTCSFDSASPFNEATENVTETASKLNC